MNLLEKILYVADYIEPNREKQPRLPKIRQRAFEDLDDALFMILEDTVEYLKKFSSDSMDPLTIETYEHYLRKRA